MEIKQKPQLGETHSIHLWDVVEFQLHGRVIYRGYVQALEHGSSGAATIRLLPESELLDKMIWEDVPADPLNLPPPTEQVSLRRGLRG